MTQLFFKSHHNFIAYWGTSRSAKKINSVLKQDAVVT